MATHVADKQTGPKNIANLMEFELALEFARVVEEAAILDGGRTREGVGLFQDEALVLGWRVAGPEVERVDA